MLDDGGVEGTPDEGMLVGVEGSGVGTGKVGTTEGNGLFKGLKVGSGVGLGDGRVGLAVGF